MQLRCVAFMISILPIRDILVKSFTKYKIFNRRSPDSQGPIETQFHALLNVSLTVQLT